MGKTPATAMTYERVPLKRTHLKRKAMNKLNNDITVMSTPEVLRRLYKRHEVGVWETITVISWIAILVSKFN